MREEESLGYLCPSINLIDTVYSNLAKMSHTKSCSTNFFKNITKYEEKLKEIWHTLEHHVPKTHKPISDPKQNTTKAPM